jgi:hypothetical protein
VKRIKLREKEGVKEIRRNFRDIDLVRAMLNSLSLLHISLSLSLALFIKFWLREKGLG